MSFSRKHEDTPHPSPATNEDLKSPTEELHSPISQNDSTETVIPAQAVQGIHPKYLIPTPGPKLPMEEKNCLTCLFDSTILEDIEPPSGIFLLEMTRKDDLKEQEFENLATEQKELAELEEFEALELDLDAEEASFQSGFFQQVEISLESEPEPKNSMEKEGSFQNGFTSGTYQGFDEIQDDFYALAQQQQYDMKTKDLNSVS